MWHGTLKGSDIQQANEKLKEQRSAIQAHLKHLESRIGELETFERSVVNFVSSYEVEYGSSATLGDPEPVAEKVAGEIASERSSSTSSQTATVGDPEPAAEKVADDEKRDGWTSLDAPLGPRKRLLPDSGNFSSVWTPAERAMHAVVQPR